MNILVFHASRLLFFFLNHNLRNFPESAATKVIRHVSPTAVKDDNDRINTVINNALCVSGMFCVVGQPRLCERNRPGGDPNRWAKPQSGVLSSELNVIKCMLTCSG